MIFGTPIGATYAVKDGSKNVTVGQPVATLAGDYSITFTGNFKTVKGHTYTVSVTANEPNGHSETRSALVKAV